MSDSALGGRSSATPRSHTQETPGSQSSLLPRLKARRPERKIPAHFPPLDSGFRSVIIYLTVCVQQKNVTRESYRGAANRRSMGSGYFLVRRSLCHHARSHPFVLRTEHFSSSTAEEMDRVLEKSCDTRMDEPLAGSNLAARILGPRVAPRRIVRREMAIREKQSGTSWLCLSCRRLAVPRGTQCSRVARPVMEGGALRRRNASLVRDGARGARRARPSRTRVDRELSSS